MSSIKFLIVMLSLMYQVHAGSKDLKYFNSTQMDPSDYLMGSYTTPKDSIFEKNHSISFDAELGINSDCGKINIEKSLSASLKNILSTVGNADKYFGEIGKSIVGGLPMLTACYLSPTWCSILKHSQLRANFHTDFRLKQCQAINKYVDERSAEYHRERSSCVNREMRKSEGEIEGAMESCNQSDTRSMADWSGEQKNQKENRLFESTAKWAKVNNTRGRKVVNLVKAFVGDTVVENGKVKVDFGPEKKQLFPRQYLQQTKESVYETLCEDILMRVKNDLRENAYSNSVTNAELIKLGGGQNIVNRQTLTSLAQFPLQKRMIACKKLADEIAMKRFNNDVSDSIDFLSATVMANPHLPSERKREVEAKRSALKDQVELTLALEKKTDDSLNELLKVINEEGRKAMDESAHTDVRSNENALSNSTLEHMFFDGSDF